MARAIVSVAVEIWQVVLHTRKMFLVVTGVTFAVSLKMDQAALKSIVE